MMKRIIIFLTFFLFIIYEISFSQSSFEIEISLNKTEYFYGENIFVQMRMVNVLPSPVHVNLFGQYSSQLTLSLYDKAGNMINYKGPIIHVAHGIPPTKILLNSGDSYSSLIDINQFYGIRITPFSFLHFLEVKNYRLVIKYNSGIGDTTIKELFFSIKHPSGREKEAFDVYYNTLVNLANGTINHEEYIRTLTNFDIQYPESVYAPFALMHATPLYCLGIKPYSKLDEVYMKVITQLPLIVIQPKFLENALRYFKNDQEKQHFLQKLSIELKGKAGENIIEAYKARFDDIQNK